MSAGDGQPRKRKDKRRKKEEEEIYPQLKHPTDEVIHVHNEPGLGGNICAKIVFFFLFSAIALIVGLILVEYRGTTDENAVQHKSTWTVAFQDWSKLLTIPDLLPEAFKGGSEESRTSFSEDEIDEGIGEYEDKPSTGWFDFSFGGAPLADGEVEEVDEAQETGFSWFFGSGKQDETDGEGVEEGEHEGRYESEELKDDESDSGEEMDEGEEEEDDEKSQEDDIYGGEREDGRNEEEEEEEEEETEEQIYQSLFRRQTYPDEDESVESPDDEDPPRDEVEENKNEKVEDEEEEEELFPEALEALRKEASELLKEQTRELEESDDRDIEDEALEKGNDEEAEGTESDARISNEPASQPQESSAQRTEPTPPPPLSSMPSPSKPDPNRPSPASQSPPLDVTSRQKASVGGDQEEEEELGEEEEELVDDDLDEEEELSEDEPQINPKIYEELLAKYGQPSPDSSDPEISEKEYSEGAEDSVGEEEESEPDEEGELQWTNLNLKNEEYETESEGSDVEETGHKSGAQNVEEYANAEITNEDDWSIRKELDEADEAFNMDKIDAALFAYQRLLKSAPESPRALLGSARCLDRLAEIKQSNALLQKSIDGYVALLNVGSRVPDAVFLPAARRAINRIRFRGMYMKAVPIHKLLIQRFNDSAEYRMDLAINYLMVNRLAEAKEVLSEILSMWPNHDSARAHFGLVLKLQDRIEESLPHLIQGLERDHNETRDARLYFHLGDALTRTGRRDEATKVYEKGVHLGLFKSTFQRSLYNVNRLTARPWWTLTETTYDAFFRKLEKNWEAIRDEGLQALKLRGTFLDEAESLRHLGDWKQFQLFARGVKQADNCKKTPVTCRLVGDFKAASGCRRGQTKFSVMEGGTHVWPHCGPTNCRLRAHLGLVVPPGPSIRVGDVTKVWEEGKVIVFDDSFEHEVWHNGTQLRLVLIVDVWHPELTNHEKSTLSSI